MGIFGGVQVVGILCSIIRVKLVAIWIGPVGVGLFGIFNQALEMLNTATNLGIRQSSVRDISIATDAYDRSRLDRIIAVVRRWSLWLGLAGALITMALAPVLSLYTFKSTAYMWHYIALAGAVLLMALTNGEYAVLQGLSKLGRLGSVTLCGTIGGLLISIPLFYLLRERSIVPSIISYAVCCAVAAAVMRHRTGTRPAVTRQQVFTMGTGFVKLGVFMTIGTFVTMLSNYAFSAWLNYNAGTEQVGLYQAGYTLVNKYTGLVFTALGFEFYPRLAKVAASKFRLRVFVSQEVMVSLLVLAPVLALFIVLAKPVISLLYTSQFHPVTTMLCWGLIGTLFRALSWCMAFVILARGDGLVFVITETLSAAVALALNIIFYRLWGIDGLGVAYLVWYIVYALIIAVVYFFHYRLPLGRNCYFVLAWTVAIVSATFAAMHHGLVWLAVVLTIAAAIPTVIAARRML